MYTSYSYYYETFRGSQLAPDQWPAAAREAEAYIDLLTCQRLREGSPVTDEVRMAVCAVAEVVGRYRAARASRADGLKSVSNDGYSESGMRGCKDAGCWPTYHALSPQLR